LAQGGAGGAGAAARGPDDGGQEAQEDRHPSVSQRGPDRGG